MLSVLYEVLNFRAMRRRLLQIYEANSLVLLNQPGCGRLAAQACCVKFFSFSHDFRIYKISSLVFIYKIPLLLSGYPAATVFYFGKTRMNKSLIKQAGMTNTA